MACSAYTLLDILIFFSHNENMSLGLFSGERKSLTSFKSSFLKKTIHVRPLLVTPDNLSAAIFEESFEPELRTKSSAPKGRTKVSQSHVPGDAFWSGGGRSKRSLTERRGNWQPGGGSSKAWKAAQSDSGGNLGVEGGRVAVVTCYWGRDRSGTEAGPGQIQPGGLAFIGPNLQRSDVLNRDKDEEPTVKQEIEEIEEEVEPQGVIVTRIKSEIDQDPMGRETFELVGRVRPEQDKGKLEVAAER
ncbi:hypothetical protein CB1_000794007 [Camelus ferus]|nr:hypothetical protein CB1_000794007 [Camelus ferus]